MSLSPWDGESALFEETADEPVDRPLLPDDPTAILTTRPCWPGVLTSFSLISEALAFSSTLPSTLGARTLLCDADNDVEVDLLLVGLNCEAAETADPCDVVLNRTTRFRTGLASLLAWLGAGDVCLVGSCALLARVCRFSSPFELTEVLKTLRRFVGFCCSAGTGGDEGRWL